LIDRNPRFGSPVSGADQALAWVGGGGDQPAHIECLWRQAAQAVPHKISEALGNWNRFVDDRRALVLDERPRALERIKGVPATCFVQPGERVPGQGDV